mmetsp:Transcript_36604/g.79713  ORF Transcript_36604/g.79713 Transcript_36604/m.79713 type:complete len:225 (+) Transcript_36604:873-1547(+)
MTGENNVHDTALLDDGDNFFFVNLEVASDTRREHRVAPDARSSGAKFVADNRGQRHVIDEVHNLVRSAPTHNECGIYHGNSKRWDGGVEITMRIMDQNFGLVTVARLEMKVILGIGIVDLIAKTGAYLDDRFIDTGHVLRWGVSKVAILDYPSLILRERDGCLQLQRWSGGRSLDCCDACGRRGQAGRIFIFIIEVNWLVPFGLQVVECIVVNLNHDCCCSVVL